jgi:hypothetical protein
MLKISFKEIVKLYQVISFNYALLPLSTSSKPALGPTQSSMEWVPGEKRQEREADYSPPTGAEVKITWICTSSPPYAFMA